MIASADRVQYLRRRYGFHLAPLIVINGIIIFAVAQAIIKFGFEYQWHRTGLGFLGVIALFNVVPICILFDIYSYRIGFDSKNIYTRPLTKFGPFLKMSFAEINAVDLKPKSDIGGNSQLRAAIVLYRNQWDGEEIFALDCDRTSPGQFKDLVRLIHDKRPETFTENALHYLDLPDLETPRENPEGGFVWWLLKP